MNLFEADAQTYHGAPWIEEQCNGNTENIKVPTPTNVNIVDTIVVGPLEEKVDKVYFLSFCALEIFNL